LNSILFITELRCFKVQEDLTLTLTLYLLCVKVQEELDKIKNSTEEKGNDAERSRNKDLEIELEKCQRRLIEYSSDMESRLEEAERSNSDLLGEGETVTAKAEAFMEHCKAYLI